MGMSTLGKRIVERREYLNLTQEALGELIGKNQKQIWRYETGTNQPTADVLLDLAHALQTTTDYLLGESDLVRPVSELSDHEQWVIDALRRGEKYEAIRAIVGG